MYPLRAEAEVNLVRRLSRDFEGKLQAFLKSDLPKRLHYVNNPRISPIILDLQPGYSVKDVRPNAKKRPPTQGLHGYDNIHSDMDVSGVCVLCVCVCVCVSVFIVLYALSDIRIFTLSSLLGDITCCSCLSL